MIRLSRTAPLLIATVASALLVAGPAYAANAPAVSSQSCTPSPAGTTPVTTCPTTTTTTPPAAGGTTTTSPTTTTPSAPASKTGQAPAANRQPAAVPVGPPKNRPGRPAGDRDCADFATQDEAQSYFESIGGSATNNADRLDANHNGIACESLDDDGDNQNASVTTTGDDESKAETSGDQVTEVPEGSAQTGGNQ